MMMKTAFATLSTLTLVACSGLPAGESRTPQLSDKERFVAAIESNGCVINTSTIGPIMAQASINQQQLEALSVDLQNDEMLAPDGTDIVRLSSHNCI